MPLNTESQLAMHLKPCGALRQVMLNIPPKWKETPMLLIQHLLRTARSRPLSRAQASREIFGRTGTLEEIQAEDIMDTLWDMGLVFNLGEPGKYGYRTTDKGIRLLDDNA